MASYKCNRNICGGNLFHHLTIVPYSTKYCCDPLQYLLVTLEYILEWMPNTLSIIWFCLSCLPLLLCFLYVLLHVLKSGRRLLLLVFACVDFFLFWIRMLIWSVYRWMTSLVPRSPGDRRYSLCVPMALAILPLESILGILLSRKQNSLQTVVFCFC